MKMNEEPSEEETIVHDAHVRSELETKHERDKDRADKECFTLCFDLENVFALPSADVSNFFYC